MSKNAKTTDPRPVVTMDPKPGSRWVFLDCVCVGRLWTDDPATVFLEAAHTAAELRAVADFLDQLEGADLLSQVTA